MPASSALDAVGSHHFNFLVTDIEDTLTLIKASGIEPVGVNLANPDWKEAFLHPRNPHGIVIQVAQPWDPADVASTRQPGAEQAESAAVLPDNWQAMRAASIWSRGYHEQFPRDGREDSGAVFSVDDCVDEECPEEAFEVGDHSCLEHLVGRRFVEVKHPGAHPIRREGKAEVVTAAP
jgi:hypothetical protein